MKRSPLFLLLGITAVFAFFLPLFAAEVEDLSTTEPLRDLTFTLANTPTAPAGGTMGLNKAPSPSPADSFIRHSPVVPPVGRFQFERAAFSASVVSLALLNTADFLSTREALKYPGVAEGNPIMSLFVKNTWAFAAVKIATTAYLSYGLRKMRQRNKTTAWLMSLTANAVYAWVVYNNLSVIEKVRSR